MGKVKNKKDKEKIINDLRNLLKHLGFVLKNGSSEEIYEKSYNSKVLSVNIDKEHIDYKGIGIGVGRETTSNFSQTENLVVLECVNRLLEKGYEPSSLYLEKKYLTGNAGGCWLDILVLKDKIPYMMIECKTYGQEYSKAKRKLLENDNSEENNQLLSYYANNNHADVLVLYTSKLYNNKIDRTYSTIYTDDLKDCKDATEVYNKWNKKYYEFGIFEDDVAPYKRRDKLLRRNLTELSDDEEGGSGYIFNQFLEILRHNGISDKPNAFNKILNLFLCKIVDEEKGLDEEVEFYWGVNTTLESMHSTLNALYKKGMEEYLNIEITDYSDNMIRQKLETVIGSKHPDLVKEIMKAFSDIKCHKSSEFAFKEIYNEETFRENGKVLKEIVELLQKYKFKYTHKQQFLGTFFENLLSTSIKQEVGQFFTPVPIARFMITSLPLQKVLKEKAEKALNGKQVSNVIPSVIDYSCGSGHFLTEFMDLMQQVIDDCDTNTFNESVRKTVNQQKNSDFAWAKDCVYGIEKDYRLVKTTKISTFLNGDGEANIIHADGLDSFGSNKYFGLLSKEGQFDFVIANPPYSVKGFKGELKSTDFEGYNKLSDDSKEIECLFVERTAQLLKPGGYAAVILPNSILSKSGINEIARQNIIKHFHIRAIAKMGKNTFMATNVETVILFLEKRPISDYNYAKNIVDKFLSDKVDFNFNGVIGVVEQFAKKHDLSFDEYVSILMNAPNEKVKKSNYYQSIKEEKEDGKED